MRKTMNKTLTFLLWSLVATFMIVHSASAAEWGSLKGQILVDGTPAKVAPLLVNKDAYCIQKKPMNEAVVIGKDNALVNAIVYLRAPFGKKVDVAPEYEAKLKEKVV